MIRFFFQRFLNTSGGKCWLRLRRQSESWSRLTKTFRNRKPENSRSTTNTFQTLRESIPNYLSIGSNSLSRDCCQNKKCKSSCFTRNDWIIINKKENSLYKLIVLTFLPFLLFNSGQVKSFEKGSFKNWLGGLISFFSGAIYYLVIHWCLVIHQCSDFSFNIGLRRGFNTDEKKNGGPSTESVRNMPSLLFSIKPYS